jgi:uncharacterized repeat protein (TIGR01451 family)
VVINVYDVEPPVLTIPQDLETITVACRDDSRVAPDYSGFTVTDNCAATATIQIQQAIPDYVKDSTDIYHYTIVRTWRAYDPAGDDHVNLGDGRNSSDVIQYIIINDDVPPVFADDPVRLQPVIACMNYETDIAAMEQLKPVFTDNCDPSPTVSLVRDTTETDANTGIIHRYRTWEAKDARGNTETWIQTIELPSNDLAVTITASVADGCYGDQVTYLVTVTNNGSCEESATASILLPQELTYLSHNLIAGDYDEATGIWKVGRLAPQASETLTINAAIADTLDNHPIILPAHVDIDRLNGAIIPETDYVNNDDEAAINGKGYAVRITKWLASGNAATAGDVVTFIIRVDSRTNTNNADFWIRDILPAGLQLISLADESAVYGPDWVKVPVPTLNDGGHREVTVTARVTEEAGDTVVNYAEVFRESAPDIILHSTTASLYTTRPDLTITAKVIDAKEATGNKLYEIDREYTFQITYSNVGALPVQQATLTASFDPNRQQVLYVNNNGAIENNSGRVTWQLNNIRSADPERFVEMRVEPLLPGASTTTFYIDTKEAEWPKSNNADTIIVDQHIWIIPNVLTDYGDNTVLRIPQLEDARYHVTQARFSVYNTWGNMVYRNRNYKGISDEEKFSGRNLSKGTYYYELVLEFDDGSNSVLKGWIMILK